MKVTKLFKEFFNSEKSGGMILIICTIFSLLMSNGFFGKSYISFWHIKFANQNIEYWINDGLMAIFFLLIGLELKREIIQGELSKLKEALLPIFGALGGMIVPAAIFLILNINTTTQSGIGIPMATDIAFALGVLSLLGKNVPNSLKVFLAALAVIDDLGAIIVIAIFYTKTLIISNLFISLAIFIFLVILNKMKVKYLFIYLIFGIVMWYFMLNSGVHATISGVLLAFAIPFGNGDKKSSSYILQHFLHRPVAFLILPIFALANTAITFSGNFNEIIKENYSLGVALGLIIGKPIGVFTVTYIFSKFGFCKLPSDLKWKNIFGVGLLAGIGFTMSIFITILAYEDNSIINNTKLIILLSSFIAGIIGFFTLKFILKKTHN